MSVASGRLLLLIVLFVSPHVSVCANSAANTTNKVKQNLEDGKPSYGAFIALFDPAITELFAAQGFDYLFIDAEHTQMTPPVIMDHLRTAVGFGTVTLVRVPNHGVDFIKPWVDAGPDGIIVPNIYGVQDAQEAVNALKFKTAQYPNGTRRVGIGRASGYSEFLNSYLDDANQDVMVVLMAERIELIDSIDEVLSTVKGIDALSLGPEDLAASMGYLGQPNASEVLAAVSRLEDACMRHGMPLGRSVSSKAEAKALQERGYLLFTGPSDVQSIIKAGVDFMQSG